VIVTLIGMMGSGKSSVAKVLADKLKWRWLDTDEEIVKMEGKSIEEIFQQQGEGYFRKREKKIIANIYKEYDNIIVATGGGAILASSSRKYFLAKGKVFWLAASIETLLARTENSSRPLLQNEERKKKLKKLLAARLKYYKIGEKIETDNLSVEEVADIILDKLPIQGKEWYND